VTFSTKALKMPFGVSCKKRKEKKKKRKEKKKERELK
jgi:hypothetical protein